MICNGKVFSEDSPLNPVHADGARCSLGRPGRPDHVYSFRVPRRGVENDLGRKPGHGNLHRSRQVLNSLDLILGHPTDLKNPPRPIQNQTRITIKP